MNIAISLFCSIFSIGSACLFLLLRAGFDTDYFTVIKTLGLSLVLLILPLFAQEKISIKLYSKWYLDYSFGLFTILSIVCVLGFLSTRLNLVILSFVGLLGYVLFVWLLIRGYGSLGLMRTVALSVFTIFLSVFVVSIIFSQHIKPLFFEDILAGSNVWRLDTLYHVSIGQMFNTYGILTSGLDGIPYVHYHYGVHVLYVGIANFLNISIIDAFLLLPPIIITPIFFFTFFCLILKTRDWFSIPTSFNYQFGLVLLMAFVGYFRNTFFESSGDFPEYAGMLMGSPILFISDSYTVSLIFLFTLLNVTLNYFQDERANKLTSTGRRIFLWVIFPLLFFCLGFTKISSLYIAFSIFCFLYVRTGLYKRREFGVSLLIMLGLFILTFLLIRDQKHGDGGIDFFYHFRETKQNILIFVAFHFAWFWVLVILFVANRLNSKKFSEIDLKRLPIEITLVAILASLGPAVLIKVEGGQLFYFTEIASWLSVAIIIAYLPWFKLSNLKFFEASPFFRKSFALIVSIYLLNVFYKNSARYRDQMLHVNYTTRYNLLAGPVDLTQPDKFQIGTWFAFEAEPLSAILRPLSSKYFDSFRVAPSKKFLHKLIALNSVPMSEKRKSLVYMNFDSLGFYLPIKCYERPFLVPALAGMAAIHGNVDSVCMKENAWLGAYSFEYYDLLESRSRIGLSQLKLATARKGFQWLYYYDPKKSDFVKIKC
jgi:hypothetical protein